MSSPAWTPWRKVVQLRDDLRSGELSLKMFAADLYDVVMDQGPLVYRDPSEFFALTSPTFALRNLARDVMRRLAGQSDKAVRQLELTYGGGKTHALITMYHLSNHPAALPNLPAVGEFTQHIGIQLPRARIAVLPFDKLDVEKGMEIRDPQGTPRWLKQPWSVLAYQIAGEDGLKLLHAEGLVAERDTAPAENLLAALLAIPGQEGLSTLILIDEVLMYAREKVGVESVWKDRLATFFQHLTQAAGKVDRCAIVASLLATDPAKSDELGRAILQDLQAVFLRGSEQGVQPVGKDDVAEVLRRRFFTPESILDREAFHQHVVAALQGIKLLDEATRREGPTAENRFVQSYPFHPDLTEVLYTKWTALDRFQRTRGILRTFALALRDAEQWDDAPLIAANVFLGDPSATTVSDAARELAAAALTEDGAGSRQEWTAILESEQRKAKEIQRDLPGLRYREIEQAVLATFLHSQPIGQKALDRDLYLLLGPTRPDRIELEKGLKNWIDVSWFLDEAAATSGGSTQRYWRLGTRPNLRQMHDEACKRVAQLVDARLLTEIEACTPLTAGATAVTGVRVHKLPKSPADVEDDDRFHFAILGPGAASESGKPSAEALRFLTETTSADRPRSRKNAILLAVPSREGLEGARLAVRHYLGWDEVENMLKSSGELGGQGTTQADPARLALLKQYQTEARQGMPTAIRQAYSIVVTMDEKGQAQAFKLAQSNLPLFNQIKADVRARIQETSIDADALLPDGPYDLWKGDETARRLSYLAGAFATDTRLPKMLNQSAIVQTIAEGCRDGAFVLRLPRPDHTYRTFWRQSVDPTALADPAIEVVLPEAASLSSLEPSMLSPGALPGLWFAGDGTALNASPLPDQDVAALAMDRLVEYFSGRHTIDVPREGFTQPQAVPEAAWPVLEEAVSAAVQNGALWLITENAGFRQEAVPPGIIDQSALLRRPSAAMNVMDLYPTNLTAAWKGKPTTTAADMAQALSDQAGYPLPWSFVHETIGSAFSARILERTADSRPWPCDASDARFITIQVPSVIGDNPDNPPPPPPPPPSAGRHASAALVSHQIQELGDVINEIVQATVGHAVTFTVAVDLPEGLPEDVVQTIQELLTQVSPDLKLRRQ